jgi:hypothetical protein
MKRYTFNEHYFDVIDNQDKAYWLGFFAADGYNHLSKGCIEFRLHNKDREILNKFKTSIQSNNPIWLYKSAYCNITLYSKHLCGTLASYGLGQAKTYTLTIPKLNNELMRHFIRGYFDGDGCFSVIPRKDRRTESKIYQFNITGMSGPLLIIQKHLVDNIGIKLLPLKTRVSTIAVTLHYNGRSVCKRILDYLYKDSNLYLERKYNKYIKYCTSAE